MALACISFYSPDQPTYDCMDRISKTSDTSTTTSSTATTMFQSNQTDQVSFFRRSELNIIVKSQSKWDLLMILLCGKKLKPWLMTDLFSAVRTWTGVSFWYMLLRWSLFLALLIFLWIIIKCAESWYKRRKRRVVVWSGWSHQYGDFTAVIRIPWWLRKKRSYNHKTIRTYLLHSCMFYNRILWNRLYCASATISLNK